MTFKEHLLMRLAEECMEVAQRCTKALSFGLPETQEGQPFTNMERLNQELDDLVAVIEMLHERNILVPHQNSEAIADKKKKVLKYAHYAKHYCDTIQGEIE